MTDRIPRQMERLLAVAGELAAARSREVAAQIAVEHGFPAVGASYGALWLVDEAQAALELAASSPLPHGSSIDPWSRIALDLDAPVVDAVRSGLPMFLTRPELQQRYPAAANRMQAAFLAGDPAYAMVPLTAGAAVVGAIAVTYERAEDLDRGERHFLAVLASQCGLAIERITAHAELERALAEERLATRARDEVLAVVTHDLRNPLGTIAMGAQALLAVPAADPVLQRVRSIAERIDRQGERMSRLLDSLTDYGAIQTHTLALERAPAAPADIVERAVAMVDPEARERGVSCVPLIDAALPEIACDARRVISALAGLAVAALKLTPKGGRVSLGAVRASDALEWFVRAGAAAHVAKSSGLPLAVARGVAAAHGGRLWLDDDGATVRFVL